MFNNTKHRNSIERYENDIGNTKFKFSSHVAVTSTWSGCIICIYFEFFSNFIRSHAACSINIFSLIFKKADRKTFCRFDRFVFNIYLEEISFSSNGILNFPSICKQYTYESWKCSELKGISGQMYVKHWPKYTELIFNKFEEEYRMLLHVGHAFDRKLKMKRQNFNKVMNRFWAIWGLLCMEQRNRFVYQTEFDESHQLLLIYGYKDQIFECFVQI